MNLLGGTYAAWVGASCGASSEIREARGGQDGVWCGVREGAAQSKVLGGLGAGPCPGVVGRDEPSCR